MKGKIRIYKWYNYWICKDPIEGPFNWNTWEEAIKDALGILSRRFGSER